MALEPRHYKLTCLFTQPKLRWIEMGLKEDYTKKKKDLVRRIEERRTKRSGRMLAFLCILEKNQVPDNFDGLLNL